MLAPAYLQQQGPHAFAPPAPVAPPPMPTQQQPPFGVPPPGPWGDGGAWGSGDGYGRAAYGSDAGVYGPGAVGPQLYAVYPNQAYPNQAYGFGPGWSKQAQRRWEEAVYGRPPWKVGLGAWHVYLTAYALPTILAWFRSEGSKRLTPNAHPNLVIRVQPIKTSKEVAQSRIREMVQADKAAARAQRAARQRAAEAAAAGSPWQAPSANQPPRKTPVSPQCCTLWRQPALPPVAVITH